MNLFLLRLKTSLEAFWEYLKVVLRYYRYPRFRRLDLKLLSKYLFKSPFTISKHYCQMKGSREIYVYGETPLTTLAGIFQRAGVSKADTVFDLGCGRARSCLWLNGVIGCKAVGIEIIPEFVEKAPKNISGLEFRCEDMATADFTGGTLFYLYGNFLSDETLFVVAKKLEKLPYGTKVISISFPMTDYSSAFTIIDTFEASFPWGRAEVYISSLVFKEKIVE